MASVMGAERCSPEMMTQKISWETGEVAMLQLHPLRGGEGMRRPYTAVRHPVLDASGERDGRSETGEFLLKVIQTTEWEMLGWASVYVSGRVSAGKC